VIEFEGVTIRSGGFELRGVTFAVPAGAYGVLMGRTGSGKTTILEAAAGLRRVEAGRIRLGGRDVTSASPAERGLGLVPQDRAIFEHLRVRDQLAFGPRARGWDEATTAVRVKELGEVLGIGALMDRLPAGLSGGEAQRVALGRALASRPQVLLLDEPLSALDDAVWDEMTALLGVLRRREPVTVLHVTHRQEEARRLADRRFVLEEGRVREVAGA
jgi:ABC-type sugar transport system ATPase subunit